MFLVKSPKIPKAAPPVTFSMGTGVRLAIMCEYSSVAMAPTTRKGLILSDNINSDADLVKAIGSGDMDALGELVGRHQQKIRALAYRTLGCWDLADDVAQEVFLRVHRSADNYQPKAKVSTWLYRIAVNLCLDVLRRSKRAPDRLPGDVNLPVAVGPDPLETSERVEIIRHAVADLPDRQRIVLNLHRYEDLSHQEITEVTGWSQSAVESLLVRAYANLRKSLAKLIEP